jgi:hypothetical protein
MRQSGRVGRFICSSKNKRAAFHRSEVSHDSQKISVAPKPRCKQTTADHSNHEKSMNEKKYAHQARKTKFTLA